MLRLLLFIVLAPLLAVGAGSPATAQNAARATGSGSAQSEAVQALEAGGNTVLIVPRELPREVTAAAVPTTSIAEDVAAVRRELGPILASASTIPTAVLQALKRAGDGSFAWLLPAGLITLASIAIGAIAYLLAAGLITRITSALGEATAQTRAVRIARSFAVLARHGCGTAAFLLVGALVAILFEPALSPERVSALMSLGAVTTYLGVRAMLLAILAPNEARLRVLPLGDRLANALFRQVLAAVLVSNLVVWFCFWFAYFPLSERVHQLMLMSASILSAILFTVVVLVHRRELTDAIGGARHRELVAWRRLLCVVWPVLAIGYFWVTAAANVGAAALHRQLFLGPVLAPTVSLIVALGVAALLLVFHDRRLATGIVDVGWTRLYENVAGALAAIVGVATLFALFLGFEGRYSAPAREAIGLALVALSGWAAWQAVRLFVATRLERERGDNPADSTDGEGFGPGASRLATLLPIVRNVMFFLIASIVLMVALASLGVDVAPLFAGAGVVGLAIGFGAQSLIRDVFSGAFFLLDDAFRRGEYVEVGSVAGQVEKISVRSFQLRHHEGALHTLPFGEIRQLTNFSRDWVIMKLPVRLTYDTDVEKVRKLVKRLGQEMAADPELGPLFMEPPKSQGVVQMEDSAMIVRVKFKTKPGDQFVLRRHVYQRLREVFAQNDIHFAHREVTVGVAGTEDEETKRRAALGAARTADAEAGTVGAATDDAGTG